MLALLACLGSGWAGLGCVELGAQEGERGGGRCLGYLAERNSWKEARLFRVEWIICARLGL